MFNRKKNKLFYPIIKRGGIVTEHRLTFFGQSDRIEVAERVLVIISHYVGNNLADIIFIENFEHGLHLGVVPSLRHLEEILKSAFIVIRGEFKSLKVEISLFIISDVTTGKFAEHLHIAIAVEKVVLKLEGDAEGDAEVINRLFPLFVSVSHDSTYFQDGAEEHCCLKPNHLNIFIEGDIIDSLDRKSVV